MAPKKSASQIEGQTQKETNEIYNQLMEDELEHPFPGAFSTIHAGAEGIKQIRKALVNLGANLSSKGNIPSTQSAVASSEDTEAQEESSHQVAPDTEKRVPSDLPGSGMIINEELWNLIDQVRLALNQIPISNRDEITCLGPRTINVNQYGIVVNPYVQLTLYLFSKLSTHSSNYDFDKETLRKMYLMVKGTKSLIDNEQEQSEFESMKNVFASNDLLFIIMCVGAMLFYDRDMSKRWSEFTDEELKVRTAVLHSEFGDAYRSYQTLSGLISRKSLRLSTLPNYCCYNKALDLYLNKVCSGVSLAETLKVTLEPDIHVALISAEEFPLRSKRPRESFIMDTTEFRNNIVDFTSVQREVDKIKIDMDLIKRDIEAMKENVKSLSDSLTLLINRKSLQDIRAKQGINKTILETGGSSQQDIGAEVTDQAAQDPDTLPRNSETKILITRLKMMKDTEAATLASDLKIFLDSKGLSNYSVNCTEEDLRIALVRVQLVTLLDSL